MKITDSEARFLAKRTKLIRIWPPVGILLILLLLGLGIWLIHSCPLLANPFAVSAKLIDDTLNITELSLSAALLPVVFWLCLGLVLIMIIFAFAALNNEKKHLALIRRLLENSEQISSAGNDR